MSQIGVFSPSGGGGGGDVLTLTGNSGGAIAPDGSGNINIIGSGSVTVTGSGTTLTIADSGGGGGITSLVGDNSETASGTTVTLAGTPYVIVTDGDNASTMTLTTPNIQMTANSVAMGVGALNGTSTYNVAIGFNAYGNPSGNGGNNNVAIGNGALYNANGWSNNIAIGSAAGVNLGQCDHAVLVGSNAGSGVQSSNPTYIGFNAGTNDQGSAGNGTALGANALSGFTGSSNVNANIAIGASSMNQLASGDQNIAIGFGVASNYMDAESGNIVLGSSAAVGGESNIMRLGNDGTGNSSLTTTQTYITGIYGNTVGGSLYVTVNSAGQLGTTSGSGGSGVTDVLGTTNQTTSSGGLTPAIGLSSTLIAPGSVTVTSGFTVDAGTITLTPLTTAGIVTTNGSGVLSSQAVLPIANGGTNASTIPAANDLIISNGTSYVGVSNGTTGQVLYANTSGVPTWGAAPAGAVTSVSGTANQATVSPTTGAVVVSTPTVFIAPGSIASTTSVTAGNSLTVTAGTITFTPLTTAGIVTTNASGVISSEAVLPIANGGTNSSTTPSTNALFYFNGTSYVGLANGTTGQYLTATTGSAPSWAALSGSFVNSITGTANQITASSSTGNVTLSVPTTFTGPGSITATTNFILPATGQLILDGQRFLYSANAPTNTFLGYESANTSVTGVNNTILGYQAALAMTGGDSNVIIGAGAASNITETSSSVILGQGAGSAYTASESNNILIGADLTGTSGESNVTRIGNGTTSTYIAGIVGVSVGTPQLVTIDVVTGQLGSTSEGGFITAISGTTNEINVSMVGTAATLSLPSTVIAPGSVTVTSGFTVDAGTVTLPYSTSGMVVTSGTGVITEIATTVDAVQIGNSLGQLTSLPLGTAGQYLQSGGPAATPVWANAVNSISGTANEVAVSASTGSTVISTPTTFIAPGSSASTTTLTAGTNFLFPATTSSVGHFVQNGSVVFHTYGTGNIFSGNGSGNFTLTGADNVCTGTNSGSSLTSGARNTLYGFEAGAALTSGSNNTYIGYNAGTLDVGTGGESTGIGYNALSSFTGSSNTGNTAIGYYSMQNLVSGQRNVAIGGQAGQAWTGSESDNILLGTNNPGVAGDNSVLRIGATTSATPGLGVLSAAYIQGITGVSVTGSPVIVNASGQLGVTVSSRRYKDNIQDMDTESDDLYKLRPVTFSYKQDKDMVKQVGLIAEEVHEIMPSLVLYNKDNQPDSVKYHDLPILLLNELQSLARRVAELETKLKDQSGKGQS